MQLDGCDVQVGDKVYDLQWGVATVEHLTTSSNTAFARNGAGVGFNFDEGGNRAGGQMRMVYWSAPLVFAPLKDQGIWPNLRSTLSSVYNSFKDYIEGGSS